MNFDNLIQKDDDRALSVYPVSFDFAHLTLTVFTKLGNSMFERMVGNSVETVSELRQKSNVTIVTYVIRKT